MKITEEMVDYVSALARLKLPGRRAPAMAAELEHFWSNGDARAA